MLPYGLNFDTGPFNSLSPGPYIALMGLGFVVGTIGHVIKSRTAVIAGVAMVFLATVLLPLAEYSQ